MKNKINLTRFELFVEDEAQNIGFLVGLDDTGISEDLKDDLLYNLDKNMIIPDDNLYKKSKNVLSFFKDKGLEIFRSDIDKIVHEIDSEGLFSVGKVELSLSEDSVLYQDEYQVLTSIPSINELSHSVKDVKSGIYNLNIQNKNSLFKKYDLVLTNSKLNKSNAIKITPDVFCNDFYYYVDFNESIVEIINKR